MSRLLTLAHLTVLEMPPPAMIRMAARLGYDGVGLRLVRVTPDTPGWPLMDDPAMMREALAALRETGMRVTDVEFVRIAPDFDPCAWEAFLDAGAALGAAHVICAPYDADLGRLADRLAAFAEWTAPRGMRPVLEFFPWTSVPDLSSALRVADATGRADVGVLVDALHFDRSDSRLVDLRAADPARLPFVHLSDAPRRPPYDEAALLHAARAERLPPGQGEIDLPALLAALPPGVPLGLEVPMINLAESEGLEVVARAALEGARRVLGLLR